MTRIVSLVIEGNPLPKARPRVTRKGTWTPKKQRENSQSMAWEIRLACQHRPFQGPVQVELAFYRRTNHPVDLDNLIKQVLDAGNLVAWEDDDQVVKITATKELDHRHPRTAMTIMERTSCE